MSIGDLDGGASANRNLPGWRLVCCLLMVAAVGAQAKGDYQMLKYFGDFSPLDKVAGVAWLGAFAATIAGAVVCLAGPRMASLVLTSTALALNVLATVLSAFYSVHLGFSLASTLKLDFLGVYPDGAGFSLTILLGGLVTLVLLAAATVVATAARTADVDSSGRGSLVADVPSTAAPVLSGETLSGSGLTTKSANLASPGWYPHPSGNGSLGYWDGAAWVEVPAPSA